MNRTVILLVSPLLYGFATAQFKQNDTLFFVREKNDSLYHRVFIDTNKKSEFYSLVSDFKISGFDKDTYKRSLNYLYSKKYFPKKNKFLKQIPSEWVMLESYKGKIYVYSPADYYFHYKVKLTDSLFIDWTGEGPEATYIQKFTKINTSTYQFILRSETHHFRELTIKYIDHEKGIALFQSKEYNSSLKKMEVSYQLMVDVKKMRTIQLLVNTCDHQKQDELDFDKINYATKFKHTN